MACRSGLQILEGECSSLRGVGKEMKIVNKTGSNRIYIDRERNENISFPKDQAIEVDAAIGNILLKIEGFEVVKEEKKKKKEVKK